MRRVSKLWNFGLLELSQIYVVDAVLDLLNLWVWDYFDFCVFGCKTIKTIEIVKASVVFRTQYAQTIRGVSISKKLICQIANRRGHEMPKSNTVRTRFCF